MYPTTRISSIVCALLVSACSTTLKVHRIDPAKADTFVGAPYPMMFTRYEVDIAREVIGCTATEVKLLQTVAIKSAEGAPDPRQLFALDINSLASALKTSEVKLGYLPNGAVSSLNAEAEDRSAQVVANVVGAGVNLMTLAAAAGAAPGPSAACSTEVVQALADIAKHKPQVKAATALAQRLTDDLKKLTDKAVSMGDKTDEGTKRKLSSTFDSLAAAQSDLADKQDALDTALKAVRHVQTVRWPDHGDQARGVIEPPKAVLKRWGSVDTNPATLQRYALYFELAPIDAPKRQVDPSRPGEFAGDTVDPAKGVPYRLPAAGTFQICQAGACDATHPAVAEKTGPVLQLGRVYHLPCESRPFTSVSCSFEMTDAGQLKTMGTANKASPAEGLSGAAKDAFGQLSTARKQAIETKTALLKAQADQAAAVAALKADPLQADKDAIAALKTQIELKQSELALLQAQEALDKAKSEKP